MCGEGTVTHTEQTCFYYHFPVIVTLTTIIKMCQSVCDTVDILAQCVCVCECIYFILLRVGEGGRHIKYPLTPPP